MHESTYLDSQQSTQYLNNKPMSSLTSYNQHKNILINIISNLKHNPNHP